MGTKKDRSHGAGRTLEEPCWAWAEERPLEGLSSHSGKPLPEGNSGLMPLPERRLPQSGSDGATSVCIWRPALSSRQSTVRPPALAEGKQTRPQFFNSYVLRTKRTAVMREVGHLLRWDETHFIGPRPPPPTVPRSQQLPSGQPYFRSPSLP